MLDDEGDDDTSEAGPKKDDGDEESESTLKRLKRWERLARNHWSKWRDEARMSYDFVAGHQWTSDDKTALLDQMRQPVTFNRVAPMVDAVCGAEILNRQEVRYLPREQGDVQVNELLTAADEWARELSDTEDEESDAFSDVVICGMAWTETRMDYLDDPEGRIVDERLDPLEMWAVPEGTAFSRNCSNARCLIRARWRDKADLPAHWRKKIASASEGNPSVDEVQTGWTGNKDDYDREDEPSDKEPKDADKRRVWVRHMQWWDKEDIWRVTDPTSGKVISVDKKQLKQMGQMFLAKGQRPPQAMKGEQKVYYQAFLAGNQLLDKPEKIEAKAFTFKCITGKRDRNANTFFGVVRAMIDPQQWGNKFFVQIMHILNTSAKGGLLYEEDAFVDPRKAIEDWAKPDVGIALKRGALSGPAAKVMERTPKVFPAGTEKMMEFALNSLPQTSGINLEMLGLVEREQAGVLEVQRKKAGYAILAVFFDSLRRYRKSKGRLRLFFIQEYISDGRLIRIKGKDSTMQYVPLVRDKEAATYDVIVDEAPMSPNQKEAVWSMLTQMMPLLSKLNVPPQVWSIILEYSPLPSSVSGKINQVLSEQAQQPPPPDPEMVKMQAQLEADKQKMAMEAQQKQQDAATELEVAKAELQMKAEEHAMDMKMKEMELQFKMQEAQIDMQAKQADLQVKELTSQQDIDFAQQKHTHDMSAAKEMAAVKAQNAAKPRPAAQT